MMGAMHLYLPSTTNELRGFLAAGVVGPVPLIAFTMTTGLREAAGDSSDEELEYLAQHLAADASLRRLAGDPDTARHRVVVVLDAPESAVEDEDGLETGAVELIAELPADRIVSALIDDGPAEPFVRRVLENPDSPAAINDLDDHQLLWFARQELSAF